MRLITSAAIPSANALPSSTWTVGEHVNSGKKHVNPLQQDAELRRLLAALQSMESKRDFGRWKTSFLQRFEMHLGIGDGKGRSSMEAASLEYQRFGQAVLVLVTHVHKVEAILAQGDFGTTSHHRTSNHHDDDDDDNENGDNAPPVATTTTSATVRARQCMVEFGKQLTLVMTKLGQLIPGTVEKEAILGYTKFHMAAVLVKNGFQEYSSLTWCRGIFDHMRNVSLANDVCPDLQIMERLSNYSAAVDRFCDVMADLGLHDAMLKCEALFGDYSDSSTDDSDDNDSRTKGATAAKTRSPRRHRSKYLSPPDSPVRNLVKTRPPTAAEVLASLKKEKELSRTSSVVKTKYHGDWEWKLNTCSPAPPPKNSSNDKTKTTTTTTTKQNDDLKMKHTQTIVKKVQSQSGKPVIVEETTTFVMHKKMNSVAQNKQQRMAAMNGSNQAEEKATKESATCDDDEEDDDDDDDDETEAAVENVEEKQDDNKAEPIEETVVSNKSEAPSKEKKPIGSLVGRWKPSSSPSNFVPNPEQWKAPTFKGHAANRYVPAVRGPTRTFNRRASLDSAASTNCQSSVTGYGGGGGAARVVAQSSKQHQTSVSRGPCFNRRASLDTSSNSQSSTTGYSEEDVAQSAQHPPASRGSSFNRRASLDSSQPFTQSSRPPELSPESSTVPNAEINMKDNSESENEGKNMPESNKAKADQQVGERDNTVKTKPPIGVRRGSVTSRYQPRAKCSSDHHSQQQSAVERTFNRRASLDSNLSLIPTTSSSLKTRKTNTTGDSIDECSSFQLPSSQSNKATRIKDDIQSEETKPGLTSIAGRAGRTVYDRGINKQPSQTPPNARPSNRRASIDCSRSTVSCKEAQPPEKTGPHLDTSLQSAKKEDCSARELPRGNQDKGGISLFASSKPKDQQQQHLKGSNDSDTGKKDEQKTMEKVTVCLDDVQTSNVKSSKVKKTQILQKKGDDAGDDTSCSSSSSSLSSSSSDNVSDIDASLHRLLVKREESLRIGKGIEERPFTGNNTAIEGKTWSKHKSDIQKPISPTKEDELSTSSSEDDSQRHTVCPTVVRDKSIFVDDNHDLKGKQRKASDIKIESESESSDSSSSKSEVRRGGKRRVQVPKEEDSDDESDSESGRGPCKGMRPMTLSLSQGSMAGNAIDTDAAPVIKRPLFNRRGSLDSSQPSITREKPKVEQSQQPVKRSSVNRRGSLDSSTISTPPTLEVKKEKKPTKESKRKQEKKSKEKEETVEKKDTKKKDKKKEKTDKMEKKAKKEKKEKKSNLEESSGETKIKKDKQGKKSKNKKKEKQVDIPS